MNNTIIGLILIASALLGGCYDGRDMTPAASESLAAVSRVLDTWETRDGKHYPGMGGAVLGEMRYARTYREGKWYAIGDHYSVRWDSSPDGLRFSVAKDH